MFGRKVAFILSDEKEAAVVPSPAVHLPLRYMAARTSETSSIKLLPTTIASRQSHKPSPACNIRAGEITDSSDASQALPWEIVQFYKVRRSRDDHRSSKTEIGRGWSSLTVSTGADEALIWSKPSG